MYANGNMSHSKKNIRKFKKFSEQRLKQIQNKSPKCNVVWFNPKYSKSVKTNVGKLFLWLINKDFSPTRKYRKIFNRNAIKSSYSCMLNIK